MMAEDKEPPEQIRRDPRQPADFEPIPLARHLLRVTRVGALGTLDSAGFPLTTLVSVATEYAGAPLLLVSGLSAHTKNMRSDQRCSLLLSKPGKGDPLAHPRLTLVGYARWVNQPQEIERARRRFLARHPKAQLYADFPDFAFYRIEATHLHLNGGFARAYDGAAKDILSPVPDEAAFEALEVSALNHINADHADMLALLATQLCVKPEEAWSGEAWPKGAWRATGLDPHGLDLALGDRTARLPFDAPLYSGDALREMLARLAQKARHVSQ